MGWFVNAEWSLSERIGASDLELTDYSRGISLLSSVSSCSIGIVLLKLQEAETFSRFVQDVLIDGGVRLVGLDPDDMRHRNRAGIFLRRQQCSSYS